MILNTKHKRKAFAITCILMALFIWLLFFAGLKYLDPPPEKGITITFGQDLQGMGEKISLEEIPSKVEEPQPTEPQELNQDTERDVEIPKEELLTQNSDDEQTIVSAETPKPKPIKTPKPKQEENKEEAKPEIKKPSSETTNVLANILGAKAKDDSKTNSGQRDDKTQGNKGSLDGNPYSNSYYGGAGNTNSGTGKGWGLSGRNLLQGEKIMQDCNESGRVVVEIEVDKQGKVVKVKPGVRGTTNSAACLIEAAKKTAMTYRWNPDENAPNRQIGFIEINFRVGE